MKSPESTERPKLIAIALALMAMVFVGFGETLRYGFINYDDPEIVSDNPLVKGGLSLRGIVWAFRHPQVGDWVPLTTISHMLDCQLFGLWAGGHHLTNLLLHAAAAVLLFLLLRKMTQSLWPSAFAAALFAIHPLRVESVAWITERKDVLCGLLSLLTIAAYLRYAQHPSRLRFVAVLAFFGGALMAKSMAVTLPFVLLLLDYWPLGRLWPAASGAASGDQAAGPDRKGFWPLLREKLPLLFLSGAAAAFQVVTAAGMIRSLQAAPFLSRVANALVSYAIYLGQALYPVGLCIFYPLPAAGWPVWQSGLALLLLAGLSVVAFLTRETRPYLLVGWLWFLGTLIPVIGLVQSGALARADRYSYFPQIGLYIAIAWLGADLLKGAVWKKGAAGLLALSSLAALVLACRLQVSYWRDSETLWRRAIACTGDTFDAEEGLGEALVTQARLPEAEGCFLNALRFHPDSDRAHHQLGLALAKEKRNDEAIAQFRAALAINPRTPVVHRSLGLALLEKGRLAEGSEQLELALAGDPRDAADHARLAGVYLKTGRPDKAGEHYQIALRSAPGSTVYHLGLAEALAGAKQIGGAAAELRAALAIDPKLVPALVKLAWILSTAPEASLRDGPQAVDLARKAEQLLGAPDPKLLRILAAALAESQRYQGAIAAAQQALDLATKNRNDALAQEIRKELALYQDGRPYRMESL